MHQLLAGLRAGLNRWQEFFLQAYSEADTDMMSVQETLVMGFAQKFKIGA